jgi:hypothetical protein
VKFFWDYNPYKGILEFLKKYHEKIGFFLLGLLDLECPFLQVIEQKQGLQFKKIVLLVM